MSEILYTYGGQLYINLTNRCPCACTFCVRSQTKGLGSADNLWLEEEPSLEQVKEALDSYDLSQFDEVVFCGYGEPTCALERMIEVADEIHRRSSISVRLNTNGLGDLIHRKRIAPLLKGHIDVVSISLNAPNEEEYLQVTGPRFGKGSFEALLQFTRDCKVQELDTRLTVVDVIGEKAIEESKALAQSLGVVLRVRQYTE